MNLRLTSIFQANAERCNLIEQSGVQLLLDDWDEVLSGVSQVAEALESQAQVTQRLEDVWRLESREGQSARKCSRVSLSTK